MERYSPWGADSNVKPVSRLAISQWTSYRQENIGAAPRRAFWRTAASSTDSRDLARDTILANEDPRLPLARPPEVP
jgi:hypothetical protein